MQLFPSVVRIRCIPKQADSVYLGLSGNPSKKVNMTFLQSRLFFFPILKVALNEVQFKMD